MPVTDLTIGLFADFKRKLDQAKTESSVSEREFIRAFGLDRGNVRNMIKKGKEGKRGADLGNLADVLQKLEIVLEFEGFVIGPAIRPRIADKQS